MWSSVLWIPKKEYYSVQCSQMYLTTETLPVFPFSKKCLKGSVFHETYFKKHSLRLIPSFHMRKTDVQRGEVTCRRLFGDSIARQGPKAMFPAPSLCSLCYVLLPLCLRCSCDSFLPPRSHPMWVGAELVWEGSHNKTPETVWLKQQIIF